ncbi:lytic transglycosylase domain-containing protein [uncultured Clostridium sp.]|uniref:lytic transglycosylase domain-containing protein n=1 Tax=uncultured Clostridium sp. TaxID=59620 RepID=UPI0026396E05|nr:lytic transglycosylase domain-containing protein [uncultured Clostridium sp.]
MKKIIIIALSIILAISTISLGKKVWREYRLKTYPYEYKSLVNEYAKEYNLNPLFVLSVIKIESNFNPNALSDANARGLMQITVSTGTDIANSLGMNNFKDEDLYNPEINIKMGCYYLRNLYNEFGNWDLVIAAYNGGRGNVQKWLKSNEYSKDGQLINIPFPETKNYVVKVNKAYKNYGEIYDK